MPWLKDQFKTDAALSNYCRLHDLGVVPEEIAGFDKFYLARREILKSKIGAVVNAS